MARESKPYFHEAKQQWWLKFKKLMPDGTIKQYHYLCPGPKNKETEAVAKDKTREIKGGGRFAKPEPGDAQSLAELVAAYMISRRTVWSAEEYTRLSGLMKPFANWCVDKKADDLKAGLLGDFADWLKNHATYVRQGETIRDKEGKPVIDPETGRPKRKEIIKRYANRTRREQISIARKCLEWMADEGYTTKVPKLPPLPKKPQGEDKSLPQAELQKVFSRLPDSAKQILLFCLLAGCRPEEGCDLHHTELTTDSDGNQIAKLRRGKLWRRDETPRIIQLNAAAIKLIKRQPSHSNGYVFCSTKTARPYKPSGLRTILKRHGKAIGLNITGAYQLRHSFAQYALDSGLIGLDDLGKLLGHCDGSASTKVYARVKQKRAAEAAKVLPPAMPLHLVGVE